MSDLKAFLKKSRFLLLLLLKTCMSGCCSCGVRTSNETDQWEEWSATSFYRSRNGGAARLCDEWSQAPSEKLPFFFLHIPKTGGSTMRKFLHSTVPCGERLSPVGGISPRHEIYDHKVGEFQIQHAHMIAGHVTWGLLVRIARTTNRFHRSSSMSLSPSSSKFYSGPSFSCLTIVRHPVERTISYWYNRIGGSERLSMQSPEALYASLTSFRKDGSRRFRGHHDEGPMNPTMKMLCGQWSAGGFRSEAFATANCSLRTARERLGRCWVGIIDDWERSCAVLQQQLPWLPIDCSVKKNAAPVVHETRETLPAVLVNLILKLNKDDMALYIDATRQLDQDYASLISSRKKMDSVRQDRQSNQHYKWHVPC